MQSLKITIICLCAFAAVQASIIHVPADQSTIQAGINAAVDGDTVLVADGTYFENINFNGKAITVASHYIMDQDTSHIANTIIDGSTATDPDSASTVLFVSREDTTSVLSGLTITGGTGTLHWYNGNMRSYCGGGIFCHRSSARIVSNIIRDNTVYSETDGVSGGGISAQAAAQKLLIIENNIIANNRAESIQGFVEGGGLAVNMMGRLVGNIVQNNRAVGHEFWFIASGALHAAGQNKMWVEDNIFLENETVIADTSLFARAVIYFEYTKHFDFLHNTLEGNRIRGGEGFGCVFVRNASQANIIGNSFTNNSGEINHYTSRACYCYATSDVLFKNNVIRDNVNMNGFLNYYGKSRPGESEAIVRGNEIVNNKGSDGVGIASTETTMLIENNIIANNEAGGGATGIFLTRMKSALVRNNLIYGNIAQMGKCAGITTWDGEDEHHMSFALPDFPDDSDLHFHRVPSPSVPKLRTSSIPDYKSVVLINNTIVNNSCVTHGFGVYVINWETQWINNMVWGKRNG